MKDKLMEIGSFQMGMEKLHSLPPVLRNFMKVPGNKAKCMVKESTNGKITPDIKEIM